MKSIEARSSPALVVLNRGLVVIAAALALIVLAGTVYGLAKRERFSGKTAPAVETGAAAGEAAEAVFSGLGTMRISTADSEPETLIISVAFPYNKNDQPFAEELASRISFFKSATQDYLGAFTGEELAALDPDLNPAAVKGELLSRYNAGLRLGQIKELYILDYMRL
ncbi:MAG: hypothetical protein LBG84_02495 [Treponema sp.]|jgi:flagellar basal body-associated protein FliL|nr:hypothetical protein [Treponema sp.]